MLAGGRGTRLASVVDTVPKPMVSVAGQPFLHWVTCWLVRQGVLDIVFSAGHLGDQIENWVASLQLSEGIRTVSRREPAPLGTGGALLASLDDSQDIILAVNGDTLFLADLAPLLSRFRDDRLDGLILAVHVADASPFGTVELGDDGLLRSFREKEPGAGIVNSGVYLIRRKVLQRLLPVRRISLERELLPGLLARGARIGVAVLERPFLDIGTPETLATAGEFVSANRVQLGGLGH